MECVDTLGKPQYVTAPDSGSFRGWLYEGQKSLVKYVWCVAKGNEAEGWEALCVDLDIAVSGQSFDEVRNNLNAAIESYVEDAMKEDPAICRELLSRRAPLYVRLGWNLQFLLHSMFGKRQDHDLRAGFDVPCPA